MCDSFIKGNSVAFVMRKNNKSSDCFFSERDQSSPEMKLLIGSCFF